MLLMLFFIVFVQNLLLFKHETLLVLKISSFRFVNFVGLAVIVVEITPTAFIKHCSLKQ